MRPTKQKNRSNYRVRFSHNGVKRTLTLVKDKSASEYLCQNIERVIAYRKSNKPLEPDLVGFLNNNSYIQNKLAEWNIIEPMIGVKHTLVKLVKQHVSENIRVTEKRRKELRQSLNKMVKYCNAVYPEDLSLSKIEGYLRFLINIGRSARTHNKHLQIAKQFTKWLDIKGYVNIDLRGIRRQNENVDKRYMRRPLGDTESYALLTNMRGKHHGLNPEERKIVFLLALEAGLRWKEITTLSVGDINLMARTVTIRPENEKARRGAILPLSSQLHILLKEYLSNPIRLPSCKLFENIWQGKGAEMLRCDLDNAGVDWRKNTNGELIDFHALRKTFGTRHAMSGTKPQDLMKLMRHSDINLTMKYYVHYELNILMERIDTLPSLMG